MKLNWGHVICTLGKRRFPLRMPDIQKLAYQFAEKKGLVGFSKKEKRLATNGFRVF